MAQVTVNKQYDSMTVTIKTGVYDSSDKRIAPNLARLLELGYAVVEDEIVPEMEADGLGFTPLEDEPEKPVIRPFQQKKKRP